MSTNSDLPSLPPTIPLPEQYRGLRNDDFDPLGPVPGDEFLDEEEKKFPAMSAPDWLEEPQAPRQRGGADDGCRGGCGSNEPIDDVYYEFITSDMILSGHPARILQKLLTYGLRSSLEDVRLFYADNENWMDEIIESSNINVARALVVAAPKGIVALESLVEGYQLGMMQAKANDRDDMAESMTDGIDAIRTFVRQLTQERTAHQAQVESFARQVTQASASISDSVRALDNLRLSHMEAEVRPLPKASIFRDLAPSRKTTCAPSCSGGAPLSVRGTDTTGSEATSPLSDSAIESVGPDGTYTCPIMTLKVKAGVLTSFDSKHPSLKDLSLFCGKKLVLSNFLWNKDLDLLLAFAVAHPDWLLGLLTNPGTEAKNRLIDSVAMIPTRLFQWYHNPE